MHWLDGVVELGEEEIEVEICCRGEVKSDVRSCSVVVRGVTDWECGSG